MFSGFLLNCRSYYSLITQIILSHFIIKTSIIIFPILIKIISKAQYMRYFMNENDKRILSCIYFTCKILQVKSDITRQRSTKFILRTTCGMSYSSSIFISGPYKNHNIVIVNSISFIFVWNI